MGISQQDIDTFTEMEPEINKRRFILKAAEAMLAWAENPNGNSKRYNDAELMKNLNRLKIRYLSEESFQAIS